MPEDALACMTEVSLEGTQELMRCRDTGVILATGGIGLVRAAYSSASRPTASARATSPPTSRRRRTCRRRCGT
jgi:hypothetical protein